MILPQIFYPVKILSSLKRDEVERIHAEGRFREVDGGYEPTPWNGYWRNYQTRNGLLVPIEGEVEWDLVYWRANLVEIDHDVSE